jgi:hypothetical protein
VRDVSRHRLLQWASRLPESQVIRASIVCLVLLAAFQLVFVSCVWSSLSRTANDSATATKEVERLHSELQTAQRQLAAVGQQLADIHARSAPPAALLASSVVPIGIRWTATDKTQRFSWKGTAFGVQGSTVLVTAAHVLEQTTNELRDFVKRDLPAEIVVRLRTGEILKVENPRYHREYPAERPNRESPVIDVATFTVAADAAIGRLPLSQDAAPEIAQEILIGGYPTAVSQIKYATDGEHGFQPTIRVGRIERLIDVSDLAAANPHSLIQCNVPIVGGFSGSPVLNLRGEVIGVATFSSHRLLRVQEIRPAGEPVAVSSTTRILDPAHVSFAVSKQFIEEMLLSNDGD